MHTIPHRGWQSTSGARVRRARPAPLLIALLLAGICGAPRANPTLPQVVNGQASFSQQGNVFSIANTPNTIINWQSFSINPGELTRFIQQSGSSSVLNRILGQDPSRILGSLQSNGRVFLINPNGILFGNDARVDVNALVASSLNMSNADFLAGKMNFASSGPAGKVGNLGSIGTPAGGQVYLIAPDVENSGVISAPNGSVVLAAGRSVELVDPSKPELHVVVSAPADAALNLGQIIAQGGAIGMYGALLNQRGRLSADSAVLGENGKIVLRASGDTLLDAGSRTSATGAGRGGQIQILGQRVGLAGDASVDASGQAGGGTVLVGGDYHGENAAVQNAGRTFFGSAASIRADAVQSGEGGKVVVWADGATKAYGTISARGGARGGEGGFVETSGKRTLDFHAKVDVGAAKGKNGTLLLDPDVITLVGGTGEGSSASDGTGTFQGAATPGSVMFGDADITTAGISNIYQSELEGIAPGTNLVLEAANYIGTAGDFSKLLTLPMNSNFILRTRNGADDGSSTKGINLTSGVDGGGLEIRAQGTGTILLETGVGAGRQLADIQTGKLTTQGGTIGVHASGDVGINNAIVSNGGNVGIDGANVVFAAGGAIAAGAASAKVAALSNGGSIGMPAGASISVTGASNADKIFLLADNISLPGAAIGAINANANGQVYIAPFNSSRDIDLGAPKTGSKLELSGAELNAIEAGDLVVSSGGNVSVSSAIGVDQVRNFHLAANAISVNGPLGLSGANGGIFLNANNSIDVAGAGGLNTNGGMISLIGESMNLGGGANSINAGAGRISLAPFSSATDIQLGAGALSAPGVLGLTDASLKTIATSQALSIGDRLGWSGNTTLLASGLDLSAASGLTGTLALQSGADGGNLTIGGPLKAPAGVSLTSNNVLSVAAGASIVAGNITLSANQMELQGGAGSIDAGAGVLWVKPKSEAWNIDLGATSAGASTLALSGAALDSFAGSGTLRVGALDTMGNLNVSAAIAPAFSGVLALQAGGNITQTGTIGADKLSIAALGDVDLGLQNNVANLAARIGDTTHANHNFTFRSGAALNVASALDGISGISSAADMAGFLPGSPNTVIALMARGALTQSSGAFLAGKAVYVEGGRVALNNMNPTGVISGKATGTAAGDDFSYASANGISLDTVNGFSGVAQAGPADPVAISLISGGFGIWQSDAASITSPGGLKLVTGGKVGLTSSLNNVGALTALGVGDLNFNNAGSLVLGAGGEGIGTADIGIGSDTGNHSININVSGGTLTVAQLLNGGTGSVLLAAQNIQIGSNAGGANIDGGLIALQARQGGSGGIRTVGAGSNIGSNNTSVLAMQADNIDFSAAAPTFHTDPNGGVLAFSTATDNAAIIVDAKFGADYNTPILVIGNANPTANNTSGDIKLAASIGKAGQTLVLLSGGGVSQSAPILAQNLVVRAGTVRSDAAVVLDGANQIGALAGGTQGGAFTLTNTGPLHIATIGNTSVGPTGTLAGDTQGGAFTLTNTGPSDLATLGKPSASLAGISSNNGAITIHNTGALTVDAPVSSGSGAITMVAHSPLTVNSSISSGSGDISLEAGSSGSAADKLTISGSGAVNSGSGAISLKAGDAIVIDGSVNTGGAVTQLAGQNIPTLSQCMLTPSLPACASVLPSLPACTVNPALPGCGVVLPLLSSCISKPAQDGCSAVLPGLSACVTAPATPGCGAVLPTLAACVSAPSGAGCEAVLPSLSACAAAPTQTGCASVLPSLAACSAAPSLAGCKAVLPLASLCLLDPAGADCGTVTAGVDSPGRDTAAILINSMHDVNDTLGGPRDGGITVASNAATPGASGKKADASAPKSDQNETAAPGNGVGQSTPATKKMYCN